MLTTIATAVLTAILTTLSALFLAERKIRREYRLQFNAEAVARKLLKHSKWKQRTFATIQFHLGGFGDDELRKLLVQAGAIRFRDAEGIELWGLIERNQDMLDREVGTRHN